MQLNAMTERLKAEAQKAAQSAAAKLEQVKNSEQMAKLKESAAAAARAAEEKATAAGIGGHIEAARSSISNLNLPSLVRSSTDGSLAAAEEGSSDGAEHTEEERLVGGRTPAEHMKGLRAGLSVFGSKLEQIGQASKAKLDETMDRANTARGNVAQAGANVSQLAREAGAKSIDNARQASAKGVDGLRTAAAAGTAGVDKIKSATSDAKGRCGEALSAAAAVSGVSMPGQPKEKACLTYKQRLIGCASCLILGTLLSLFSLASFAQLLLGNPGPFALKFTVGNLLSLGAATFLVGPRTQLRGMMAPQRRVASLVYMATLVGTLVAVFGFKRALLSLAFILAQQLALTWYILSYIPYGQTLAKKLIRKLLRRGGLLSQEQHKAGAVSPADDG